MTCHVDHVSPCSLVRGSPSSCPGERTYLVNLAIADAGCAGEPAADGESEGRGPGDTARARDEGGAGRSSREGGNAAIRRKSSRQLNEPQLAPKSSEKSIARFLRTS